MCRGFLFLCFIFISPIAYSSCDFKEANFIDQLGNPKNINKIIVQPSNNLKFSKNAMQIMADGSANIPRKFKKNFRGVVEVIYKFGRCKFDARIRQSGDWRDHIKLLPGGRPLRSVVVRLKNGNILNSVRFRLLIPASRHGTHEVLGSLLLRELGFISPETFEVKANVAGTEHQMIFQETARKELLERNQRREGPIFEGDETLIWDDPTKKIGDLEPISLARLTNDEWFLKGPVAREISLYALLKLQQAFINYALDISYFRELAIFPNKEGDPIFANYFFALQAMKGEHALRPHNRQFYFNGVLNKFEPIYYDGNLSLHHKVSFDDGSAYFDQNVIDIALNGVEAKMLSKIQSLSNNVDARNKFKNRTFLDDVSAERFFDLATTTLWKNAQFIWSNIDHRNRTKKKSNNNQRIDAYFEKQKSLGVEQFLVTNYEVARDNYLLKFRRGTEIKVTPSEFASIISKNQFGRDRVALVPQSQSKEKIIKTQETELLSSKAVIVASTKMGVRIEEENKFLVFDQKDPHDWALIIGGNLDGWRIVFNGIYPSELQSDLSAERYNLMGLTGCLNIYESKLVNLTLEASGGSCEDIVNVVRSTGSIVSITVSNGVADAVDFDFSNLKISNIEISNAKNDCVDVSGGIYEFELLNLNSCGDKGLSVGEASTVEVDTAHIKFAGVGISSKDLSKTQVNEAAISVVEKCYEAVRKKQEFGGSFIAFDDLDCVGTTKIDNNSVSVVMRQ